MAVSLFYCSVWYAFVADLFAFGLVDCVSDVQMIEIDWQRLIDGIMDHFIIVSPLCCIKDCWGFD